MEAKLPINTALEWTPRLIRKIPCLREDNEKKTRYNLVIYTCQQNIRDIETFQLFT